MLSNFESGTVFVKLDYYFRSCGFSSSRNKQVQATAPIVSVQTSRFNITFRNKSNEVKGAELIEFRSFSWIARRNLNLHLENQFAVRDLKKKIGALDFFSNYCTFSLPSPRKTGPKTWSPYTVQVPSCPPRVFCITRWDRRILNFI